MLLTQLYVCQLWHRLRVGLANRGFKKSLENETGVDGPPCNEPLAAFDAAGQRSESQQPQKEERSKQRLGRKVPASQPQMGNLQATKLHHTYTHKRTRGCVHTNTRPCVQNTTASAHACSPQPCLPCIQPPHEMSSSANQRANQASSASDITTPQQHL